MNFSQLKYFVEVAHMGSISAAAKALFISQPSVSKAISDLEKEIGTTLFDRTSGHIHLNPKGQVFLEYVEQSFAEISSGLTAVNDLVQKEYGSITIASVYSISFLPELIRNFYMDHPEIRMNYHLCNGKIAAEMVLDYRADFSVVTKPLNDDRFETVLLNKERIYALIGGTNELSSRDAIYLSELKNEKFLCNPASTSRLMTIDICNKAGFVPEIVMECNDQALNELILEGLPYIYLMTKNDAESRTAHFRFSSSRTVAIKNDIAIPVILCRRKNHHMSAVAAEFYNYIIGYSKRVFHN